jgi:hypothetical protein
MTRIIDKADLAHSETSYEFEGYHHQAGVSFIVVDAPPGSGPKLHKHPYEEVFVLQEGTAMFTAQTKSSRRAADRSWCAGRLAAQVRELQRRATTADRHSRERTVHHRVARRLTQPPVVFRVSTRRPRHSLQRGPIRSEGGNRR